MYIIADKNTDKLISVVQIPVDATLRPTDIYPQFDPKVMKMGWTDAAEPPDDFKIEDNGKVVELSVAEKVERGIVVLSPFEKLVNDKVVKKSLEEQVKEGMVDLSPHEKVVDGSIVEKTLQEQVEEGLIDLNEPFQYVDGNTIVERPIAQVVKKGFLKTGSQCDEALDIIDTEIETKVAAKYKTGYELKLTKRYLEWLNEGKPADDRREDKYLEMQTFVEAVKKEYKPVREIIRKKQEGL